MQCYKVKQAIDDIWNKSLALKDFQSLARLPIPPSKISKGDNFLLGVLVLSIMYSGKRLKKIWDHPKQISIVKPSRYQQSEAKDKQYWKNIIHDIESFYTDDKNEIPDDHTYIIQQFIPQQFWESSADRVAEMVGPKLFKRITKIFDLPSNEAASESQSEHGSKISTETIRKHSNDLPKSLKSLNDGNVSLRCTFCKSDEKKFVEDELKESMWSDYLESIVEKRLSWSKSEVRSKTKSTTTTISYNPQSSMSARRQKSTKKCDTTYIPGAELDEPASSSDELVVHDGGLKSERKLGGRIRRYKTNPHFDMLHCTSVSDMIKWRSKLTSKDKILQVSKSDELNSKAEIMTKKISKEFYEWWLFLSSQEFNGEINAPEDVEELFQIWFNEHASRTLKLNKQKVLPCTVDIIARNTFIPEASCKSMLKRQIASDIEAENTPGLFKAFGKCLPEKMKQYPPRNNTKKVWQPMVPPEDLRTMSCVWQDIEHLTITKAYHKWLECRPLLSMPPYLQHLNTPAHRRKRAPRRTYVVPSDILPRTGRSDSDISLELTLPVSQFSYDLRARLSILMNH